MRDTAQKNSRDKFKLALPAPSFEKKRRMALVARMKHGQGEHVGHIFANDIYRIPSCPRSALQGYVPTYDSDHTRG
jgi:hypothetical protein